MTLNEPLSPRHAGQPAGQGVWFVRVLRSRLTWTIILLLGVNYPLGLMALNPVCLLRVHLAPRSDGTLGSRLRPYPQCEMIRADGPETFFELRAALVDSGVHQVTARLLRNGEGTFRDVAQGKPDSGRDIRVQIPLRAKGRVFDSGADNYTLLVVRPESVEDGPEDILLDDDIRLEVTRVAGGDQTLLLMIGLVASVIQVAQLVAPWIEARWRDRSDRLTVTADADPPRPPDG